MAAAVATAIPRTSIGRRGTLLLLGVPVVFLVVFFAAPMVYMGQRSLENGGLAGYVEILSSPVYLQVLGNSFKTALLTTLSTVLLGYPLAYAIARVNGALRILLLGLVLMPFWSSLLARTFSWLALLQDTGLINTVLNNMGLIDQPLPLVRTELGVTIAMVHLMLPYFVLPLFATMVKIDRTLLRAAESLGANAFQRFYRVFLPLSMPGVGAGASLVFILSLGFYITPAVLGDPNQAMIGEVIATELQTIGFSRAGALGIVLLVATLVLLAVLGAARAAYQRSNR
ncbi:ABC transporter permease [Mycolicibacterium goodii]|uniref:ABC transporter permease n=1 Tax=Mycolicibacterium goodii TaxID=134601 RepID=UPI001BDBD103|nr:ABC transporter permease [Mycolicibacterium goodii]MBU8834177.1 ABC transporter permease [Mycolicibacterium goodii]